MRKDYTPVSGDVASLGDVQFLDRFWTGVFAGQELSADFLAQMEKRDEFKVMRSFLSAVPCGGTILDGGCGLGDWTVFLAKKGFQVKGVDISPEIVARLKKKFPQHEFEVGDIRNLRLPDASLDVYFSWGTFEHFEEGFGAPIVEARRVLKKEGLLFITVPFYNGRHQRRDNAPLARWDDAYDAKAGYASQMRFYQWRMTASELERELVMRGFKVLALKPIHKWHGVYRMVKHDFGVDPDTFLGKVLRAVTFPFVSDTYASHMIMAVAKWADSENQTENVS